MKGIKRAVTVISAAILILSLLLALAVGAVGIYIYKNIDFDVDELLFRQSRTWESTSFYASSSEDSYLPVPIEQSGALRKVFYSLDEISPYTVKGFVAVEDKIFYEHKGIDVRRTLAAAINYITKKDKLFGASTITQQVVKNISGDNQIKLSRKLSEIIRALRIEKNYSKDEILEVYLNVIPMSDNIYGIGAASRAYFGKEPSKLTPAEAATLIGITNAPTKYNPYNNPEECMAKRNIVLSVMRSDGIISDSEYEREISRPLGVIARAERHDRFDSWFVECAIDEVSADLAEKYGISASAARVMLLGGGYSVYTTMDIGVQKALDEFFENTDNFPTEVKDGLNYSMVVINSKSGDLAGIVGRVGKKEGNRLLNHATVPHIPGSALKPLALYAPLIDEGRINWATVFDDVPISFTEYDGEYREYPRNSPAVYDGLTTVADALRTSKNTVALRLCELYGERRIYELLKNGYGFNTLVEREVTDGRTLTDIAKAPLALGQLTRGVSLMKLTESYATFASGGVGREARTYLTVKDYRGETVLENAKDETRMFKKSTAEIMNRLLMGVTESGTAKRITLKNALDVAGKTGTSGGNRDKTFVGYTPYYTAGIWCGYDSGGASLDGTVTSHLDIWDAVMTEIHSDIIADSAPETFSTSELEYLPYCKDSGEIYSENCMYDPRGSRLEYGYFAPDNRPNTKCTAHIVCLYDSVTKAVATRGCPEEDLVPVSLIRVEGRSFPKEIFVTDAEYVYRDIGAYTPRPTDYSLPYFYYAIPDGEYVGTTDRKKQFNSNCYLHDE